MSLSDTRFKVKSLSESYKKITVNWIYLEKDIKVAVKELKEIKFYKGLLTKAQIWSLNKDELCDMLEKIMRMEINHIFGEKLT